MQSIHTPGHKQQLAASCPRVTNDSASKSTPLLTELGRPASFLHRHSQFASDLFNATMRINLEPSKLSSRLNCPGRWAILMGRGGGGGRRRQNTLELEASLTQEGPVPRWRARQRQERDLCAQQWRNNTGNAQSRTCTRKKSFWLLGANCAVRYRLEVPPTRQMNTLGN